jgi:transposase-like protein
MPVPDAGQARNGGPNRTGDVDLVRRMYEQDRRTVSEIAVLLSISRSQVRVALKAAGVPWRSTRKKSPIDPDHLRVMVAKGEANPTTLARQHHVARNTAARWLADAGLLGVDPAIDEHRLRELYVQQQLSSREVAARLGVNKSRILRALAAAGIPARPREMKRPRTTRESP